MRQHLRRDLVRLTVLFTVALATPGLTGAHPIGGPRLVERPQRSDVRVSLETVATGLAAPNWGVSAPGIPDHLFVTDQPGVIWAIDLAGAGAASCEGPRCIRFLDVSDLLVPLGLFGPGTFDERGLLGVAFHPDYASNGLFYTYTSQPVDGPADFSTIPPGMTADHQSVVTEWIVANPGSPPNILDRDTRADPASARVLLRIDEPQFNHDGGALNFGPDGMLFISLGDGGAADDQAPGHGESGNGQDPSNVLGTILRIDPDGGDSANGQYGIPVDNPLLSVPGVVPEIYAFGFRNPFRFSFDSLTGDLYAGDVGQNHIEEVDLVEPGGNYGWNLKEGSLCFDPNGDEEGFAFDSGTELCPGEAGLDLIDPIAEYNNHHDGHSVIGGFVYRGSAVGPLVGRYVFGDFSSIFVFNNAGLRLGRSKLFFLDDSDTVRQIRVPARSRSAALLGFGQDDAGELYVMRNETGVPFSDTGTVSRIAP